MALAQSIPAARCTATLRPYQQAGVQWLHLLAQLGLGACLADDMGLGKTIQVLSLLLVLQASRAGASRPCLLVAPASLLANWAAEIARFAPEPAARSWRIRRRCRPSELQRSTPTLADDRPRHHQLRLLLRVPWLADDGWQPRHARRGAGDQEPGRQADPRGQAARTRGRAIALTGTPVENRLGDLWSIFDFINPGLLGSARQFTAFAKRLAERGAQPLRPAARAGAALHPAPHEDRQGRSSPTCPTRPR